MRKNNVLKCAKRGMALGMAAMLMIGTITGCGGSEDNGENKDKAESEKITMTNVSYDPTRELYQQYNELFKDYYKEKTGDYTVTRRFRLTGAFCCGGK